MLQSGVDVVGVGKAALAATPCAGEPGGDIGPVDGRRNRLAATEAAGQNANEAIPGRGGVDGTDRRRRHSAMLAAAGPLDPFATQGSYDHDPKARMQCRSVAAGQAFVPRQPGSLVLVDHQNIQQPEGTGCQRRSRCQVMDDAGARGLGTTNDGRRFCRIGFHLCQENRSWAERRIGNRLGLDPEIGARCDDDLIVAATVRADRGAARRRGAARDAGHVHAGGDEPGQRHGGQRVLADGARHRDRRPVARGGHSLVGALSAGFDRQRRGHQRLARLG